MPKFETYPLKRWKMPCFFGHKHCTNTSLRSWTLKVISKESQRKGISSRISKFRSSFPPRLTIHPFQKSFDRSHASSVGISAVSNLWGVSHCEAHRANDEHKNSGPKKNQKIDKDTVDDGPAKSESPVDKWFIPVLKKALNHPNWCRISQPSTASTTQIHLRLRFFP